MFRTLLSFDMRTPQFGVSAIDGLTSLRVMVGLLGDVEHHQPAMTVSLLKRFCRTFRTLPGIGSRRRSAKTMIP